jgi:hypothetical protein
MAKIKGISFSFIFSLLYIVVGSGPAFASSIKSYNGSDASVLLTSVADNCGGVFIQDSSSQVYDITYFPGVYDNPAAIGAPAVGWNPGPNWFLIGCSGTYPSVNLFFQQGSDGQAAVWGVLNDEVTYNQLIGQAPGADWALVTAVEDQWNVGVPDLVWQNVNGMVSVWYLQFAFTGTPSVISVDPARYVVNTQNLGPAWSLTSAVPAGDGYTQFIFTNYNLQSGAPIQTQIKLVGIDATEYIQ